VHQIVDEERWMQQCTLSYGDYLFLASIHECKVVHDVWRYHGVKLYTCGDPSLIPLHDPRAQAALLVGTIITICFIQVTFNGRCELTTQCRIHA
jgi:hypothetical protein